MSTVTTPEREFLEQCLVLVEEMLSVLMGGDTPSSKVCAADGLASELLRDIRNRLVDLIRQEARTP